LPEFYAQRNSVRSVFRLRTDLVLTSTGLPFDMSAAFD
jgi:hypothetical protein